VYVALCAATRLRVLGEGTSSQKSGSSPRLVLRDDSGFADTERCLDFGDTDTSVGVDLWPTPRSGITARDDAGLRFIFETKQRKKKIRTV
jgi:hypothetical protein